MDDAAAAAGSGTGTLRQQLLILYSAVADLHGAVVAWSLYDGSSDAASVPPYGQETEPPYPSVVAAMRDGWRVMQLPQLPPPTPSDPYAGAHLRFEYVLERIVDAR